MIRKHILLLCMFIGLFQTFGCKAQYTTEDQQLRKEIAQMLLVGFRGMELTPENHIYRDITEHKIGGVILFEYDAPSRKYIRNIASPEQLKKLISDLQHLRSETLLISIDQEGGRVNRLKEKYGFPSFASAKRIGLTDNKDTTHFWAQRTAETLQSLGINLNFAPCTDVDVNPNCPAIGKIERSFSPSPQKVTQHAAIWIEEQRKCHVISSLKHFPGHGSSSTDTHLGVVDVSESWSERELIPYRELIEKNGVDMIMTSHVFNANLDSVYPATLSYNTITELLRNKLHFQGVVVTDDLAMGAMVKQYPFDKILELAILAGADLLCLSNNGETYDNEIVLKAIDIIYKKVKEGKITKKRIHESYVRIQELKNKL